MTLLKFFYRILTIIAMFFMFFIVSNILIFQFFYNDKNDFWVSVTHIFLVFLITLVWYRWRLKKTESVV
jgi:hypothetical protein